MRYCTLICEGDKFLYAFKKLGRVLLARFLPTVWNGLDRLNCIFIFLYIHAVIEMMCGGVVVKMNLS